MADKSVPDQAQLEGKPSKFSARLFFQALISVLVLALCASAYSFRCQLQSVQKSQQGLTATMKAMQVQVDSLLREQQNDKNAYAQIQDSVKRIQGNNTLIESEALDFIKMAYYQAHFLSDFSKTKTLLFLANARLSQVNDPRYAALQAELESLCAALKAQTPVDKMVLATRLDNLSANIIPLFRFEVPTAKTVLTTDKTNSWRDSLWNSWKSLNHLIVVRHHDAPYGKLLSEETAQAKLLYTQSLLQEAKWAVLYNNDALYQNSLQAVYGILNERQLQNLKSLQANSMAELKDLQTISLNTALPDLSGLIQKMPGAVQVGAK